MNKNKNKSSEHTNEKGDGPYCGFGYENTIWTIDDVRGDILGPPHGCGNSK